LKKIFFSEDDRFKRKLINEIIETMIKKGFMHLKPISDPYDFITESIYVINTGMLLKISIMGNKHQFNWQMRVGDGVNQYLNITNEILSRFINNNCVIAGSHNYKMDKMADFIETVNKMKERSILVAAKANEFLDQHGDAIKSFSEKTGMELCEFLKTLQ